MCVCDGKKIRDVYMEDVHVCVCQREAWCVCGQLVFHLLGLVVCAHVFSILLFRKAMVSWLLI